MATERVILSITDVHHHYHLPGADFEATNEALEGAGFEAVECIGEEPRVMDGDNHLWRLPGKDSGDIVKALTAAEGGRASLPRET